MEIGKQIKYYRLRKGARQEDLAEYLGISCQAVSKWETESSLPDIALLPRLSVYLGVSIDELFRLPAKEQMDRIENALEFQDTLDAPAFQGYHDQLEALTRHSSHAARAHTLLSALYNHRAAGDHQAAIRHAARAIELAPNEKMGWVYLVEGHEAPCGDEWWDNHGELITFCLDFLAAHPGHFQCLYTLIESMLADKRYLDAIPYVEQLAALPGRGYQAEIYRGDIAQGMGRMEEALERWDKAVEENPAVWQVWCDRGDRLKKLGRYEEALADYEQSFIIQSPPRISDGLYSKAQLLEQLGRWQEAIRERRRIIQCLQQEYQVQEEGGQNGIGEQKRIIARLEKHL